MGKESGREVQSFDAGMVISARGTLRKYLYRDITYPSKPPVTSTPYTYLPASSPNPKRFIKNTPYTSSMSPPQKVIKHLILNSHLPLLLPRPLLRLPLTPKIPHNPHPLPIPPLLPNSILQSPPLLHQPPPPLRFPPLSPLIPSPPRKHHYDKNSDETEQDAHARLCSEKWMGEGELGLVG